MTGGLWQCVRPVFSKFQFIPIFLIFISFSLFLYLPQTYSSLFDQKISYLSQFWRLRLFSFRRPSPPENESRLTPPPSDTSLSEASDFSPLWKWIPLTPLPLHLIAHPLWVFSFYTSLVSVPTGASGVEGTLWKGPSRKEGSSAPQTPTKPGTHSKVFCFVYGSVNTVGPRFSDPRFSDTPI